MPIYPFPTPLDGFYIDISQSQQMVLKTDVDNCDGSRREAHKIWLGGVILATHCYSIWKF